MGVFVFRPDTPREIAARTLATGPVSVARKVMLACKSAGVKPPTLKPEQLARLKELDAPKRAQFNVLGEDFSVGQMWSREEGAHARIQVEKETQRKIELASAARAAEKLRRLIERAKEPWKYNKETDPAEDELEWTPLEPTHPPTRGDISEWYLARFRKPVPVRQRTDEEIEATATARFLQRPTTTEWRHLMTFKRWERRVAEREMRGPGWTQTPDEEEYDIALTSFVAIDFDSLTRPELLTHYAQCSIQRGKKHKEDWCAVLAEARRWNRDYRAKWRDELSPECLAAKSSSICRDLKKVGREIDKEQWFHDMTGRNTWDLHPEPTATHDDWFECMKDPPCCEGRYGLGSCFTNMAFAQSAESAKYKHLIRELESEMRRLDMQSAQRHRTTEAGAVFTRLPRSSGGASAPSSAEPPKKKGGFKFGLPIRVDVSDRLHTLMEEINVTADSMVKVSTDAVETGKEAASGLKQFGAVLKRLAMIVPIAGALYYISRKAHFDHASSAITILFGIVAALFGQELWDKIRPFFRRKLDGTLDDEPVAQGPEFDDVGDFVSTVMTFGAFDGKSMIAPPKEIHKRMAHYERSASGWSKFSKVFTSYVEKFFNWLRGLFGKDSITLIRSGFYAIDKWNASCIEFLTPFAKGEKDVKLEDGLTCAALIAEGEALAKTYRSTKDASVAIERRIVALQKFQAEHKGAFSSFRGSRAEPACLALIGKSGVGKSHLLKNIIACVLAKILNKETCEKMGWDFSDEIYSQDSGAYWEGFRNQMVLVIDDWLQSNVVPGSPENDAMTLIRAVNEWPWPLNMAFGGKGHTFFRSVFICLTTNLHTFVKVDGAMADTGALVRRIHYPTYVRLRREFSTKEGRLDIVKHEAHCAEVGMFSFEPWVLQKHDFETGHQVGEHFTVEDLIDRIVLDIQRRARFQETSTEWTKKRLQAPEPVRSALFRVAGPSALTTQLSDDEPVAQGPPIGRVPLHVEQQQQQLWECFYGDSPRDHTWEISTPAAQGPFGFLRRKGPGLALAAVPIAATACAVNVFMENEPLQVKLDKWFDGVFGHWATLAESALFAVAGFVIGVVIYKAAKRLFNAVGYSDKNDELTVSERVKKTLGKSPQAVQLAAAKFARYFTEDDVDENYVFKKEKLIEMLSVDAETESNFKEKGSGKGKHGFKNKREAHRSQEEFAKHTKASELPEAHCTVQATWDVREIVRRNAFRLSMYDGASHTNVGVITLVRDNIAICPGHFFEVVRMALESGQYKETDHMEFVNACTPKLNIEGMTLRQFLALKVVHCAQDIDLVKLPVHVPAGKDLVDKFMSERDYASLERVRLMLDPMELDPKTNIVRDSTVVLYASRAEGLEYRSGDAILTAEHAYKYINSPTKNGDCGSPLFVADNTGVENRTFAGIHVAGTMAGVGFCAVPTRELIERMLSAFTDVPIAQSDYGFPEVRAVYPEMEGVGSMVPIATVDVPLNVTSVSKLTTTPLANKWGPLKDFPARLCPFKDRKTLETIDPMRVAIQNYCGNVQYIDPQSLEKAAHLAFVPLWKHTGDVERKVYSFEEAVAGDPYVRNAHSITMGTSPGYPWNIQGHTDKRRIFGRGQQPDYTTPYAVKLREQVEEVLARARKGERAVHIFSDLLKDELRSSNKVMAGKTRLISGAPLAYVVAFRMMFMSFTSAVQNSHIVNGVAIGCNPYTQWGVIVKHLHSMSRRIVAGDYKAFDGSELPQVHNAICGEINKWYGGTREDNLVRRVLYMDVYASHHLAGFGNKRDTIVRWNKSLPSGHPATSVLNSFYNIIIMILIFDTLTEGLGLNFWEHVHIVVYGDDNLLAVSELALQFFNQQTIGIAAPLFGMTYTPEVKDAVEERPSRTIEQVSFLKRSFVFERGQWLCPLDLDSVLYRCYWTRDRARMFDNIKQNLEGTLEELALHPDKVWDEYAGKISSACAALEFPVVTDLPIENKLHYLHKVMSSDYAW